MPSTKIAPPENLDTSFLDITRISDRLIKRNPIPSTPPNANSDGTNSVLTKDVPLNPNHNTWLRLYLPSRAKGVAGSAKLPLIVFYHGGGFILFHADSTLYHDFCVGLADQLGVVVISVEYRLAPEHRLPAAYEDAMEGLHWIKTSKDEWISKYADISNCYLSGSSAGGNIAYQAGLRGAVEDKNLEPLKIQGLILHHPYFGGVEISGSEHRLVNDPIVPLHANHMMWDLSLPVNADRDHEYSNPMVNGGSVLIERIRELGLGILVAGCYDDPLFDRCVEFAKMMDAKGVRVVTHFGEGYHAMEMLEPFRAADFYAAVKDFISP